MYDHEDFINLHNILNLT